MIVAWRTLNIALSSDPPSLDPHKTPSPDIPHYLLGDGLRDALDPRLH